MRSLPKMSHERWALHFAALGLPADLEKVGIFAFQQEHPLVLLLPKNECNSCLALRETLHLASEAYIGLF